MINSVLISIYHPDKTRSLWILWIVGAVLKNFDTSVLIVFWVSFLHCQKLKKLRNYSVNCRWE